MKFQNELQKLRKNANLSQEELASRLDVSRQTISKWESGTAFPDMMNLINISDYFHVSVDSLIKEAEENSNAVHPIQKAEKCFHYEYKSKKHFRNLPVLHVNIGFGKYTAKGIIAVGNISKGIISIGLLSVGLFAFGIVSAGLFAMAALSCGFFAMGGGAIGVFAVAGTAVGIFTLGGVAVGVVSIGGCSIASHIAIGGYANAPVAVGQVANGQSVLLLDDVGGISKVTADMIKNLIASRFPNIPNILIWWATFFFK